MDYKKITTETEWLNTELGLSILKNKYMKNGENFKQWLERVSGGNPEVYELILTKKFLPAGRVLSNRGIEGAGTYSNCASLGYIEDDMGAISKVVHDLMFTFKAQGGQGVSFSKLRPKGTPIGKNYKSDGVLPFLKLINTTTQTVSQGGCIASDELVLTNNGYKEIKDIKLGDKVHTKVGFVPVDYVFDKGIQDVFEVTTRKGYKIRTTIDHKFCVDGFNTKRLSELSVGDNLNLICGDGNGDFVDNEIAYFLGVFFADGYVNERLNSGNITFNKSEEIVAKKIQTIIENLGFTSKICYKDNHIRVYLNKAFVQYLSNLNLIKAKADSIEIPDMIMKGDRNAVISFVSGAIDSDGCLYETAFKYNTISEKYANQFAKLLSSIGFFPSISVEHRTVSHDGRNRRPLYTISDSFRKNQCNLNLLKTKKTKQTSNSKHMTPYTMENTGLTPKDHPRFGKISHKDTIGLHTYVNLDGTPVNCPMVFDVIKSIVPVGKCNVYDISLEKEHLFNCNGIYVSNSRRGACIGTLDIEHKDAIDFIDVKNNDTECKYMNLSLELSDDFMQYVELGNTEKKVHREYTGAETHYLDYVINPTDLFERMCYSAWQYAEMGCIFTEEFKNYNLMQYCDDYKIETCNPCVSGETLILTKEGEVRIDSVVDKEVEVWNGYEFSKVTPMITGVNQPMKRITFSNGVTLDCTHYHKFILKGENRVQAIDLKIGDVIEPYTIPILGGNPITDFIIKSDISIDLIEDISNCETVYCFNEPMNHSGIFNGVITANCGEQPLPKHGTCNLGSLNLYEFVENKFTKDAVFNFDEFIRAVHIGVDELDRLLDENEGNHALEEQREMARNYRNIGLGVFGYADMLIALGIKYGDDTYKHIFETMFREAVKRSSYNASIKGVFPKYSEDVWKSDIIQIHFDEDEIEELKKHGLRNCSLLSIAPTGSISNMLGRSGGIEPNYAFKYRRKTESLHGEDVYYDMVTPIVNEYIAVTGNTELPRAFVTSIEIHPFDRVDVQAVIQGHIDTAISSTVNLPNETTLEDVKKIYLGAWNKGCKGITIYRDGCAREGVLSTDSNDTKVEDAKKTAVKRGDILSDDPNWVGKSKIIMTGCGSLHVEAYFDQDGNLMKTYLNKGSNGGCNSFMTALSRLVSTSARGGVSTEHIVDQLKSVPTCPSYAVRTATKRDTSKGSCCPVAIGYAIEQMRLEVVGHPIKDFKCDTEDMINKIFSKKETHECPECGEELIFANGCSDCKACGYSTCG